MHILIIEDEEQLCRSMAEGLRMDGYETDTCFDGEEGLELCMTENYDLILLDLNLPGIDGLEILRQFRTFNTNTPVLILSARVQIQDKVEGLDLGANDYLTKPFHFEELEARIRSLTKCRHGVLRCFCGIVMQTSMGIKPFFKRGCVRFVQHPRHDHEKIQNCENYQNNQ